jgi:hypothetical protein
MALGSVQPLSFTGSATHGGGSCQISITYDQAPTASSTWKVIHSIEGGCPIQGVAGNNGNDASAVDPSTYSFTIPSTLPTGTAVLAWTWFNKIGNREMYMNCAPITLTASTSKRSEEDEELMRRNYTQFVERDTAAYNALPDMFVANIPSTDCLTADSQDLAFPNPGDSLEKLGTATATPTPPSGPSCGVTKAAVASSVVASAGSGSVATAVTSAAASKATSAKASSAASSPGQGGVFVTVATSAAPGMFIPPPAPYPTLTINPVASSAPASSAGASGAASKATTKATVVASSAAPASTSTTGTGSAIAAGTACTTEGMFNCIGGTSFQQCASGTWSVVQSVAAGTTCTSGESMSMGISAIASKDKKMKRTMRQSRFSKAHLRRHLSS